MSDIIKVTAFVAGAVKPDGKMDFAGFNGGFKQFFGITDNFETVARSTVQLLRWLARHSSLRLKSLP